MLQNPSFDNGGNYWNITSHAPSGNHWYVYYTNGMVEFKLSSEWGGAEYPAQIYVYQVVQIPNFNASRVVSATLTMKDIEHAYRPQEVHVRLAVLKGSSYLFYKDYSLSSSWTIRIENITNVVKQNTGQNITIQGGWWMSGDGNYGYLGSGSNMEIDWIYFNITYNATNSGGSSGGGTNNWWSGGGGSWSDGGSGWSGGGSSWHGGGGFFGILGGWFGHTGNVNQTYVEYEVERLQELLAIGAGITISILWVNVAVNYFSGDPDRKAKAKEKMTTAFLGTLLVAMAVIGAMWAIAGWLVGGG